MSNFLIVQYVYTRVGKLPVEMIEGLGDGEKTHQEADLVRPAFTSQLTHELAPSAIITNCLDM